MKRLSLISIVLLVIVLASLTQVIKKDSTINLLILIFLYITLATGWNILGGYAGQTSLGHAAYFGLSAWQHGCCGSKVFPSCPALYRRHPCRDLRIADQELFSLRMYFAIGTWHCAKFYM